MKIRLAAAALVLASTFALGAVPANAAPESAAVSHSAVVNREDSGKSFWCFFRIRLFCPHMR